MNYNNSTIQELAADTNFINWVIEPTAASDAFWLDFVRNNASKSADIKKAALLIKAIREAENRPITEGVVERVWQRIDATIQSVDTPLKVMHYRKWWWAVAASITLVGFFTVNRLLVKKEIGLVTINQASINQIETANTTNAPQIILLPDSSKVFLEKGAKLHYPSVFDAEKRAVYLDGEAFFEVAHDAQRPFLVYANDIVTKVLGTSFRIKTDENNKTIVSVKTGKVSVFKRDKKTNTFENTEGVVLTPNLQVVYDAKEDKLKKDLVQAPAVLVEQNQAITFNNATVTSVFKQLSTTYGVDIIFDEVSLHKCTIIAKFDKENLYERLSLICKIIGARYDIVDAKVVISEGFCQ
jgi:ferric-dicitrate binding protein FerR (iron transport regulator)